MRYQRLGGAARNACLAIGKTLELGRRGTPLPSTGRQGQRQRQRGQPSGPSPRTAVAGTPSGDFGNFPRWAGSTEPEGFKRTGNRGAYGMSAPRGRRERAYRPRATSRHRASSCAGLPMPAAMSLFFGERRAHGVVTEHSPYALPGRASTPARQLTQMMAPLPRQSPGKSLLQNDMLSATGGPSKQP